MRHRRPLLVRSLACFTAAAAVTALSACSAENSSGGGSVKPTSYSIGAALPLSGPSTALGQYFQRGVATAVQQVNDAGGIDGVKLNVYYADNQLQAAASVTAMNQLISQHSTQAVIMTSSAGVTATAPIATKDNVLMLNPGGEDPTLQKLSPNLISNIPNVKTEVDVMLPYLRQQGHQRMAMYAEGDALGATTTDLVKQEWTKLGGTFLGAESEPITVVDHSSVIAKFKSMNPDILYVLAGGQQAGTFVQQARQEGLTVQMVGASPLQGGDLIPVAKQAAEGILDSDIAQPLKPDNPKAVAYQKEFAKLYPGQDPTNVYSVFAHDAVLIYAQAAQYMVDHKIPYNGANLAKAILTIKSFQVAGGTTVFSPDGSSTAAITFSKIQGGKFVPFKTVPAAGS
ncbi:MAG TPA: ABC transporter substrate-binding protein [Pseudonocardiaceae bacterium]|jgi:ABC-type branched-subunit amino acid transport system substrate-binding protein|nr:ABC transporter substrate-binding protein [Pseudonocardiaceae bacterium]